MSRLEKVTDTNPFTLQKNRNQIQIQKSVDGFYFSNWCLKKIGGSIFFCIGKSVQIGPCYEIVYKRHLTKKKFTHFPHICTPFLLAL